MKYKASHLGMGTGTTCKDQPQNWVTRAATEFINFQYRDHWALTGGQ